MRKGIKQDIRKKLNVLEKLHNGIPEEKAGEKKGASIPLLEECQNYAIEIGNMIEQIEGKNTKIVPLLEAYCEQLYRMSLEYTPGSLIQLRRIYMSIKECFDKDFRDEKLEIVFLPYKASMWDSLESVWMAAEKEDGCNCHVVPIPYFSKKADGSLGDMFYEGAVFPEYVPIENWEEYDLESNRPDIVFIHNPYDNGNILTTIHPAFYSKRLKQFTAMLVYIPYFVSGDSVNRKLCVTIGGLYADRIILQDENIRKIYMEEYNSLVTEMHCEACFGNAEKKFVAIGSPKFDKIMAVKREEVILPDLWKKLIFIDNGKRKKVILYNTTVTRMLSDQFQVLVKIKNVLDFFREREDFVLWWRPHPLNLDLCKNRYPELLDGYLKLIADFKNEGWGIYDDSPDLDRAIVLSDAYYGDESSVAVLCKRIGKPVMIQNICSRRVENSSECHESDVIHSECFIAEKEGAWFAAKDYNALFEVKWLDGKCRYLGSIPHEKMIEDSLYAAGVKYLDYIVLAPFQAEEIAMYHTKTSCFRKIPLKSYGKEYIGNKFIDIVAYKNFLYLIPLSYPALVRLDMDTEEVIYFEACIDFIENHRNNERYFFNQKPVIIEDKLWAGAFGTNYLMEFGMEELTFKMHKIEKCEGGTSGLCYDGEKFWLLQYPVTKIISWDPAKNLSEVYAQFPAAFHLGKYPFSHIVYENEKILLLPEDADGTVVLCPMTGSMRARIRKDAAHYELPRYMTYFRFNNYMYFLTNEGIIVQLNTELFEEEKRILVPEEQDKKIIWEIQKTGIRKLIENEGKVKENMNQGVTLKNYTDYVAGDLKEIPHGSKENSGEKIIKYVKRAYLEEETEHYG